MTNLYIILGIVSTLLLSGCLDNTKTNMNINGENVSVVTNNTANTTDTNSSTSGNTYPVGSNITKDGTEIYS